MNLPVLERGLLWETSQRLVDDTLCVGERLFRAGDFNVNGTVDAADYQAWKIRCGDPIANGSELKLVPEPAAQLLAVLGLASLPLYMRRR